MKNIIRQLFGAKYAKKTNKLTAWMSDLDDMDDLAALQFSSNQLAQMLSSADGEDTLTLQQQLDFMIEIEARNQARLDKLSTQFSSVENMKADLATSISEICYNYCRQSYICHLKVIEKVFDTNNSILHSDFVLESETAVLIIARALNVAFNMIKWRLFSHAIPPANVWLQVFVLYRIASHKMLLNIPIESFKAAPSTTLSAHFVQTCMLGQLSQASMQKYHVETASRILKTLLTRAHISEKLTPEQYVFYIDLEKDAAAKRMRDFEPNDRCRYWELDELEKQLVVGITVSDRGEIPQSLAFANIHHVQRLNETLRILVAEWKKVGYVRQRRNLSRQSSSKTARVNAGITDICNQVHQANQISSGLMLSREGSSLEARIRAHTVLRQSSSLATNSGSLDSWIVTDESPRGLGTRINKFGSILARPDKLIGLIMDDDPSKIIIGMIRSVKPTQGNQLRVGVEIVSRHPTWVQLRQARTDEIFPNTASELQAFSNTGSKKTASTIDFGVFSGIYLPIEAGISDTSLLILPKINYRANSNYAVNIAGSPKTVLLGNPIESRDDWVKVTFPF
jgi:hypothetical protein